MSTTTEDKKAAPKKAAKKSAPKKAAKKAAPKKAVRKVSSVPALTVDKMDAKEFANRHYEENARHIQERRERWGLA